MKHITPFNRQLSSYSKNAFRGIENDLLKALGSFAPFEGFDLDIGNGTSTANSGLDWFESEDAYVARLELPGVKSKDIALEVENGVIAIAAIRISKSKDGEREERLSHKRQISIPEAVDAAKVSAKHEDGVLSLIFPKAEKAKARRIEVK